MLTQVQIMLYLRACDPENSQKPAAQQLGLRPSAKLSIGDTASCVLRALSVVPSVVLVETTVEGSSLGRGNF